MKKFTYFILIMVSFLPRVLAETVTLVNNEFDDIYTYYYDNNLGRYRYLESGRYSFGGNVAYCLEIGKRISSMVYNISNSFDDINISENILNRIKLISYYGYDYPNHQTDRYYMATQELIWSELISSPIKWTIGFNPNNLIDLSYEKEDILNLMKKHNIKPSFDNEEIEVVMGEETTISDYNNVLSMYESTISGVHIDGNRLIIGKNFSDDEIILEKVNYNEKNFLLYTSGNSQTMMSVGGINMTSSKINVKLVGGTITMNKLDYDNNSNIPQGEASLDGAEYGLYDSDNNLIDILIIGKNNKIENLPLGKYYIKEIKASNGYLLDDNGYDIEITKDNLNINLDVYEKVIKRKIELFKVYASDKTGILVGEANIKFDIYNKDGNLISSVLTDSDGYGAVTLPYGEYTFRQVNVTEEYEKVDDFKINVDKYDERPIYKLLSNSEIKAKLKVVKRDLESGETINNSNAKFKIFDVKNNEFISFHLSYPDNKVLSTFELMEDGTFITPEALSYGEYILYEVDDDLDGYLYNDKGVHFFINNDSNVVNDIDNGPIVEVSFYNKRCYGEINIIKYGEKVSFENNTYFYNNILLSDVVFEVYAKEDIYVNDEIMYKAYSMVGKIVTDNNGKGSLGNLPLGKYYIKEVISNNGNVISDSEYDVNLEYKDQYTEKVSKEVIVNNYLSKGKLIINKYDKDTKEVIANTLIEIRNMDDEVIYKGYTDNNGQIVLNDLPYGKYYLSEIEASHGYKLLDDNVYFEVLKDETIINLYNERVEVPITGINVNLINIVVLILIVILIILMFIFNNKKVVIISGILIIISTFIYNGYYLYNYYTDYYNNKNAIGVFTDNKIGYNYDERYDYEYLIEIPEIGLKRGIVNTSNKYNDVKYNIELIDSNDKYMILASHSGNNYNSYFRDLDKLELGDVIKIYDNDKIYEYVYSDSYVVEKNGEMSLFYDDDKKVIMLVTCSNDDNNSQIVYIGYLEQEYNY